MVLGMKTIVLGAQRNRTWGIPICRRGKGGKDPCCSKQSSRIGDFGREATNSYSYTRETVGGIELARAQLKFYFLNKAKPGVERYNK